MPFFCVCLPPSGGLGKLIIRAPASTHYAASHVQRLQAVGADQAGALVARLPATPCLRSSLASRQRYQGQGTASWVEASSCVSAGAVRAALNDHNVERARAPKHRERRRAPPPRALAWVGSTRCGAQHALSCVAPTVAEPTAVRPGAEWLPDRARQAQSQPTTTRDPRRKGFLARLAAPGTQRSNFFAGHGIWNTAHWRHRDRRFKHSSPGRRSHRESRRRRRPTQRRR